ncbi:RNA polymerase sigma factor [Actinomycetospora sp. CA-053990]|uniref:RNA polymerase sigma factor n=1 Tax=Actinomycetospora sp. CA-053990 TaxID=3239891 RepID=UPI003D944AED
MTPGRAVPSTPGPPAPARGPVPSPEPAGDRGADTAVIRPIPRAVAALDTLPAVQRRALLLRHARGMTPTEIAAFDGVAVDVVERRLAHGALALAHRLGAPGTPEAVAAGELAPLGGFADASLAPTTPAADGSEGRRRRLPIVAASLAAASVAALGAAVATSQGLDHVEDTAGPGSPIGTGSAPGLGAMLPPPAAGTDVAPGAVPSGPAVGDLGLRPSPDPSSGPVPSLAASPGPLAGVPTGGSGPVDAGAPRVVAPGVSTARPSPASSPAPSSSVTEPSSQPSSQPSSAPSSAPSDSASPSTSASDPGPTTRPEARERRDGPPRAPARRAVARATTGRVVGTGAVVAPVVSTPPRGRA